MDKYYYEYNTIHREIQNKAQVIKNSFNPDIILAIGGGGLIPARILRTFIDKPIYVISVKGYEETIKNDNVEIIQWLDKDLSNKKVLIVDEVDDTRTTLKFCVDRLRKLNNVKHLGIFVVNNKIKNKVWNLDDNIKYFSAKEMEDIWIVYPGDTKM